MRRSVLCTSGLALALVVSASACDNLLPERPPVAVGPPATTADSAPEAATPARRERAARPTRDTAKPVGRLTESQAFSQIRRALRRLVAAEQAFFAENGAYTEDLDRLGYRREGETAIRFLWLNRDGWAVSGTHPAIPGRDCVLFVGRVAAAPTSLKFVRTGREGVAACDDPPLPRRSDTAPPPPAPAPADTASALDAVEPVVQMRVDLRNLVTAQNAYFQTQGIYSRRMEPFALQYLWHRGVTVRLLTADAQSWSASATHANRPGKSCTIWFGPVSTRPVTISEGKVAEKAGTPVCDD
jgi:hypothetical protein